MNNKGLTHIYLSTLTLNVGDMGLSDEVREKIISNASRHLVHLTLTTRMLSSNT